MTDTVASDTTQSATIKVPVDSTPLIPIVQLKSIIGYQYGAENAYMGTYEFPNNQDKEDIHLPPNTVLDAPPAIIPAGQRAVRDVANSCWVLEPAPALPRNPFQVKAEEEAAALAKQEALQKQQAAAEAAAIDSTATVVTDPAAIAAPADTTVAPAPAADQTAPADSTATVTPTDTTTAPADSTTTPTT